MTAALGRGKRQPTTAAGDGQQEGEEDDRLPEVIDFLKRDPDIENLLGNFLIAQYQVDKLKSRLIEKVVAASGYSKDLKHASSGFLFKQNNSWYRLTVDIQEFISDK